MKPIVASLVSLGLASLGFAAPAFAQEVKTAKDAYLEAWLEETAERDFAKALQLYQRCVDLGATSDKELAAKALVRMARIAQARDEVDVAKAFLERVQKDFAGTKAAGEAASARVEEKPTDDRQAAAVENAKQLLIAMLADGSSRTIEKVATVFRVLSPEQIVETYRIRGGGLADFLYVVRLADQEQRVVDLALTARDAGFTNALLNTFVRQDRPVPDRLIDGIDLNDVEIARAVAMTFLSSGKSGDFARFERLIGTNAQFASLTWLRREVLERLAQRSDPAAAGRMGAILERFLASQPDPKRISEVVPTNLLLIASPAADALRELWPKLPTTFRSEIVRNLQANVPCPDGIERLVRDPEPSIRQRGLLFRLVGATPEQRRSGIELFQSEPHPWPALVLSQAVARPLDPTAWLDAANDELKEALYFHLMVANSPRPLLPLVQRGLDRNEPQMLNALCGSPLAKTSLGVELGLGADAAVVKVQSGSAPIVRLLAEIATVRGEKFGERLARAVAARPDEEQRRNFLRSIAWQKADVVEPAIFAILAVDPSPALRLEFVTSIGLDPLDREARTKLLLDADAIVANAAIERCSDQAAMVAAAPQIAESLCESFAMRAEGLRFAAAARAVWPRLDPHLPAANRCFALLWRTDVDVLIDAMRRGGDSGLRDAAAAEFFQLALPDAITAMRSNDDRGWEELCARLAEHRSEIADAIRIREVEIAWRQFGESRADPKGPVRTLTQLNAVPELTQLLSHSSLDCRTSAAWGLVSLGKVDIVRKALRESARPLDFVRPALEGGLAADISELARSGRIDVDEFVMAAGGARPDQLAAVLFPPGQSALRTGAEFSLDPIVDFLAARGDADALVTAVDFYGSARAIRALFGMGRGARVLDLLPRLRDSNARMAAWSSLVKLTGIPEGANADNAAFPQFQSDQDALIARWRAALAAAPPPK